MNKEKSDTFDTEKENLSAHEKTEDANIEQVPLHVTDDNVEIVMQPLHSEPDYVNEEGANVEQVPLHVTDDNVEGVIQPVQDNPSDTQEKPLASGDAIAGERTYTSVDDVPDVVIPESKLLQELEKSEPLEAELFEDDEVIIRDGVVIPKYQKADIDFQKTDHDKRAMVAIIIVAILAVVTLVLLYFGVTPLVKDWQENQPKTTAQPQEAVITTSEIVAPTKEQTFSIIA